MDEAPAPSRKAARAIRRVRADVEFVNAGCAANRLASGLGEHDPERDAFGNLYCVACGLIASVPATDARGRVRIDKERPVVSDAQRRQADPIDLAFRKRVLTAAEVDASKYGECRYCRSPLSSTSRTREHLRPLSRGGAKNGENLADSCSFCNQLKGPATDGEFVAWIETGTIAASIPHQHGVVLVRAAERGLRLILARARESAAMSDENVGAI